MVFAGRRQLPIALSIVAMLKWTHCENIECIYDVSSAPVDLGAQLCS